MLQLTEMSILLGSLLGSKRSHPNKFLSDHLMNVAEYAKKLAKNQNLKIDENLLLAISSTHDVGKVHPLFQKHLDGIGQGVNHAKSSAWFTFSITNNIWAAEIVCRHHTNLRNINEMITEWANDNSYTKTLKSLLPNWPYAITDEQFDELQDYLYFDLMSELSIEKWLSIRLLYSLLISADRMEAIGIESLEINELPDYLRTIKHSSNEINDWREKTKQLCLQKAQSIEEPGVYTLTLPTGAGKTLTGLSIAHDWAKKFNCKTIIYGLPFISIVEQTASVARNIFGQQNIQEDHSLAYSEGDSYNLSKEDLAWKKMITLFRYWREPVILTTLVHFWEALLSPKANHTMNFQRFNNAVVILDEPQTISPRYWKGFGQILDYLSQEWNTFFLLMTATQPYIASKKELAPPNTFFPYNRHHYNAFMKKKINIDDLGEFLESKLPVKSNSGLVVMNRKSAAIRAYQALKKLNLNAPILLLSGWVTPYRRRVILRYLKWLEKKRIRRYLVATQVIEAGVDLDFDWVFRDIGPMDSIIQVGGRCNRHSRKDFLGKVLVAELTNEKGYSLWRNVYDEILIEKTKEVLVKKTSFTEKEVRLIVDEYYKKITEGLTSTPIFESLSKGQWGEYAKLIEDNNIYSVTIFIEENNKVIPMLERLENDDWTLENHHERKKLVQKVMQYAIEIPIEMLSACRTYCANIPTKEERPIFRPIFNGRAWLLCKEAINKHHGLYSPVIGFVPPEDDFDSII